jgi:hypothetical protein
MLREIYDIFKKFSLLLGPPTYSYQRVNGACGSILSTKNSNININKPAPYLFLRLAVWLYMNNKIINMNLNN